MNHLILIGLLFGITAPAYANYGGLSPIPKEYKPDENSKLSVPNMPRVRTQDSIGICYAFSTSTLLDEAYCIDKKIDPCSSASDDQRFSPLDLTRFNKIVDRDNSGDRFEYEGLSLEGGGTTFSLFTALRTSSAAKESCSPFDNLVAKTSDPHEARRIELATWQRFEKAYSSFKEKSKTCVSCGLEYATAIGSDFRKEFNLKTSNQEVLEAFASDTYEKFLDKLLIPDGCWDFDKTLGISSKWSQKIFPEKNKKGDYNSFINEIKKTLTKKRPIAMGFCTQTPLTVKSRKECGSIMVNGKAEGQGHSVVIKGYRKVCNSKNECRESLQVQNSWGQSWQDNNNDGWVDAKELLDRTFYESEQLTWLETRN